MKLSSRYLRRVVPLLWLVFALPGAGASLCGAQLPSDTAIAAALPYFGNYLRPDGSLVSVGRGEQSLFFMDYRTGRRDGLQLRDGRLSDAATRTTFGLSASGADLLVATAGSRDTSRFVRKSLGSTDVKFRDDTISLSGTLWEPTGKGPFPAIVLLHGAGAETRYAMRQYPYFFVSHGYAVLTYDKRGSGKSTGDWHPWVAGTDVLAADAAAAVNMLRMRPEIQASHIGLLGISNGAWVAVRTAATTRNVAFLIPIVGGSIPMWQQELYRIGNEGRAHHLDDEDQSGLDRFMRALYSHALFDSLPRDAALQRIDSLRAVARGTRWFAETPIAPFGDAPSSALLGIGQQEWQRELSYDPAADLSTLEQPMLVILGGADQDVPATSVAAGFRRDVPRRNAASRRILIIRGVNHYLLRPGDASASAGDSTLDQFDPELFTTLGRWLDARRQR